MLSYFPGYSLQVLMLLVLVAVLLSIEAGYLAWRAHRGPQARKLQQRLQALSAVQGGSAQAEVLRNRALSGLPWLEQALLEVPRIRQLDRLLVQSGLGWTVGQLLTMSLAAALAGAVGLTLLLRPPLALVVLGGLLAGALPAVYVSWHRAARLRRIERQLPEALDLMVRALRAGHAFSSTLKMTGEEMADPIASEFRTVHDEVNFGVSLPQALTHLNERVPLTDLRYFVVAVLVQRDSGGNLTEILGNLSQLIRKRLKLLARVRVLSSEGRMSAWVLGLMPFVLAGVMNLVNPDFMSPLWKDPIGIAIVQTMLTLMALGFIVLRMIVRIRV